MWLPLEERQRRTVVGNYFNLLVIHRPVDSKRYMYNIIENELMKRTSSPKASFVGDTPMRSHLNLAWHGVIARENKPNCTWPFVWKAENPWRSEQRSKSTWNNEMWSLMLVIYTWRVNVSCAIPYLWEGKTIIPTTDGDKSHALGDVHHYNQRGGEY